MGALEPEAPKTCSWATNIFNKEPKWVPNISDYDYLMGLGITSRPTSTEFGLKLQQKLWLSQRNLIELVVQKLGSEYSQYTTALEMASHAKEGQISIKRLLSFILILRDF